MNLETLPDFYIWQDKVDHANELFSFTRSQIDEMDKQINTKIMIRTIVAVIIGILLGFLIKGGVNSSQLMKSHNEGFRSGFTAKQKPLQYIPLHNPIEPNQKFK